MADTSAQPNRVQAPATRAASQRLLCPFDLQLWTVDRMLNFEITNDQLYEGLELQCSTTPPMAKGWPSWASGERTGASISTGNLA